MTTGKPYWQMSLAALSAAYAEGSANPVSVIEEVDARIARLNPGLNAYVALAEDRHDQARVSHERLASGRPRSALEGVPLAIKDNLVVAGLPATWGSEVFKNDICHADELPIKRLREAGAILCGKTNTPEFAVEGYTANRLFGVTRNPWNPALTPGGSSGGTVAAVAAGLAQAGVGTDGGGSTRRPAGHTGLFGLKPTIGTIPRRGGLPQLLMDFEVVGSFARSARDLRLLHQAMAGADRADPVSRRCPTPVNPEASLHILMADTLGDNPCDPAIQASLAEAAGRLRHLGHRVVSAPLPFDLRFLDDAWPRFAQIGLAHLVATVPGMEEKASPKYLDMAAQGARLSATDLFAALESVHDLRRQVSQAFEAWDIILMPSAAAQPWPAEEAFPDRIDGHPVGPRGHAVYTGWVNACGHPGLTLPGLPDSHGMPIGVQIIGDLFSEAQLLHIAEAFDAAGPGWRWPAYAWR